MAKPTLKMKLKTVPFNWLVRVPTTPTPTLPRKQGKGQGTGKAGK